LGLVALHGAHRLAVDQLPADDAIALLRRLVGARVDAEPDAATGLVERCVRLPLTLRLAAELAVSRPSTPLARLVDELRADQRTLDLLSGGDDQRAAVRAVFSWSLRQLSDEATSAFVALGRHPAPTFDAYVLAALAGGSLDRARTVLDTLVRAHLVQLAGADRYGMHDLLKAYAAETGDGEDAAMDRVYGYYLATAAMAMDRLYPAESQRRPAVAASRSPVPDLRDAESAREWLAAELSTLESLAAHAGPEHAITLSALLFRHLDGHPDTLALAIHGHARDGARAIGDVAAEANALTALGGVHMSAGRPAEAMADMWAALALFTEVGNEVGQARVLCNVGMIEERSGRYTAAVDHYRGSLLRYRESDDTTGPAHVLTRLGTVEARLGRITAGQDHLRAALALHRAAGNRFGEAWVKLGLGEIAAAAGETDEALALHTAAADLFRLFGHVDSEAWAVDGLGRTETLRGRPFAAAAHHSQALEVFRRTGDRDGEAWALNGLGEACHAGGSVAAAAMNHTEALVVATRTSAHEQVARAHQGLALATADADEARRHHDLAAAVFADLGLPAARAEPARHRE
jgi:tetratricopeptide (TPR) repeat protein